MMMGIDDYFEAALNTITAKWWELRFVKMFGRKSCIQEEDTKIIFYKYRGKVYITDRIKIEPFSQSLVKYMSQYNG